MNINEYNENKYEVCFYDFTINIVFEWVNMKRRN